LSLPEYYVTFALIIYLCPFSAKKQYVKVKSNLFVIYTVKAHSLRTILWLKKFEIIIR